MAQALGSLSPEQLAQLQAMGGGGGEPRAPIKREEPKVGRNDPCPCGSGKKYKKCHGVNA